MLFKGSLRGVNLFCSYNVYYVKLPTYPTLFATASALALGFIFAFALCHKGQRNINSKKSTLKPTSFFTINVTEDYNQLKRFKSE